MKIKVALTIMLITQNQANIKIESASYADLDAILDLDNKITLEYFLPLCKKIFPKLKEPASYLEEELENDSKIFRHALINPKSKMTIQVARSTTTNKIAGFMALKQVNTDLVEIELLLVDQKYRGQKVGLKLIKTIFDVFKDAKACQVFPFQKDTTWKFYEKAGFKRVGVGPEDKLNFYGQKYSEVYYHYRLGKVF